MNATDFNLLAALTLGFVGSSHCLAMCGGISGALGMGTQASGNANRGVILAGFNLGRIFSYGVAGLFIGIVMEISTSQVKEILQPLRWIAGLLLVAMGCYVAGWWMGLTQLERMAMPLWRHLQPLTTRLMPVRNPASALALGAIWGWLPCGMVYSTLAWAASSGSAIDTTLAMLAFGLGTAPAMIATGAAGSSINQLRQLSWFRRLAGVALIVFGLWTLPAIMPGNTDQQDNHHHHHHQPSSS